MQNRLYTGFFHQRFVQGRWVIAEGAIYKDSWSEDLIYDQKDEPTSLRLPGHNQGHFVAADYGASLL